MRPFVRALPVICLGLAPLSALADTGGAILLTGHDPDFHAQGTPNSRSFLEKALDFVRQDREGKFLVVQGISCSETSNACAPSGHLNPLLTLYQLGYRRGVDYDVVDATALETVVFEDYAYVFVPSDFGGLLGQDELDVLGARSADIIAYINGGGGLIANAESGGGVGLTNDPSTYFQFLPFVVSTTALHRAETGNTVTAYGASLGFTDWDANGAFSHNVFTGTGGMEAVDVDPYGNIITLAWEGEIDEDGVVAEDCDVAGDEDEDGLSDHDDPDCQACGNGWLDPGEACDDGATGSEECSAECVVLNQAPEAVCEDVVVEADDTCMACASADGGSSDPDGDTLTVVQDPDCDYDLGDTEVTLSVSDGSLEDTCAATVTVVDTTAPGVEVGDDLVLWPPNHTLHTLSLSDCATALPDNCDGGLDIDASGAIVSISSDEPEDARGGGDGSTTGDIVIVDDATFQVRAERQGGSDGRVYSVTFEVSDAAGNATTATCHVTVPHSQNGTPATDSGASAGYTVQ